MRTEAYFNDGWKFYRGSLPEYPIISKRQTYTGIKSGRIAVCALIPKGCERITVVARADRLASAFAEMTFSKDKIVQNR